MGEIRHLVLLKFKEGVVVEEIVEEMSKLASELDSVKSFEWGVSAEGDETLRQGFTHVFMLSFRNAEDLAVYLSHPTHVEIADAFMQKIDKVLLLDYPAVVVKPSA